MPEISQDAFEVLNPGAPNVTPQELRARANSSGSRAAAVRFKETVAGTLPPRTRTKTISEAELDSFHQTQLSAEHLHGYKRESAHR